MIRKTLKKYGNSLVVIFDKEDIKIYGLKEGDIIDIGDMLIDTGSLNQGENKLKVKETKELKTK